MAATWTSDWEAETAPEQAEEVQREKNSIPVGMRIRLGPSDGPVTEEELQGIIDRAQTMPAVVRSADQTWVIVEGGEVEAVSARVGQAMEEAQKDLMRLLDIVQHAVDVFAAIFLEWQGEGDGNNPVPRAAGEATASSDAQEAQTQGRSAFHERDADHEAPLVSSADSIRD